MKRRNSDWVMTKNAMYNKTIALIGHRIPLRDVEDENPKNSHKLTPTAMYIKENSYLTDGLDESHKRAIHFGLFTEMLSFMHFTDFNAFNSEMSMMEKGDKVCFSAFFQTIERAAVEQMAPTFVGGSLIDALKYKTLIHYKRCDNVDAGENPFFEYLNALTHFADIGTIKGYFKDKTAKKLFYSTSTDVINFLKEGNGAKRVEMAREIFESISEIWEPIADEINTTTATESEESDGSYLLSAMESFSGIGAGSDFDAEEMAEMADLSKGIARDTTFKEYDSLSDEEKEAFDNKEKKAKDEDEDELEKERVFEDSKGILGNDEDVSTIYYKEGEEADLSTGYDFDPDQYEISVEGMDFLDRLIEAEMQMEDAKEKEAKELPEFDEINHHYGKREYKLRNNMVRLSKDDVAHRAYDKIVNRNIGNINNAVKKFKTIFAEDADETEYRSSGKISVERSMTSSVTTKLFTKSKDPEDKSNMAVTVLIDESGSMHGSRIERAKEAAICITEIFAKLGIPTYTLGFTADTNGADVVHNHYTNWKNTKADRWSLTAIDAKANNFDGYSIRYAAELLNLRGESHKVLVVISDGEPAAYAYHNMDGYRDTKDAIREARANGETVLGVAIGADVDVLYKMYGNDFIFVENNVSLFNGIMKKFTEMVKKW